MRAVNFTRLSRLIRKHKRKAVAWGAVLTFLTAFLTNLLSVRDSIIELFFPSRSKTSKSTTAQSIGNVAASGASSITIYQNSSQPTELTERSTTASSELVAKRLREE